MIYIVIWTVAKQQDTILDIELQDYNGSDHDRSCLFARESHLFLHFLRCFFEKCCKTCVRRSFAYWHRPIIDGSNERRPGPASQPWPRIHSKSTQKRLSRPSRYCYCCHFRREAQPMVAAKLRHACNRASTCLTVSRCFKVHCLSPNSLDNSICCLDIESQYLNSAFNPVNTLCFMC